MFNGLDNPDEYSMGDNDKKNPAAEEGVSLEGKGESKEMSP